VPNHSAFRKRNHACGRTIWIADAHQGDGKRYVVRADEKLTAFMELEAAIRTPAIWIDKSAAFYQPRLDRKI
jgi:hypothetical protein